MKKKFIVIILILTILFSLSGCWSATEITDVAFLAGAAIEKVGKEYKITYQVLIPEKVKKSDPKGYIMISSTGPTIQEATRRLVKGLKRQLILSQTRAIIVSPEIAKENINQVLDFGFRSQQFRLNTYIYIAEEPAKILGMTSPLDSVSAFGLSIGTDTIKASVSEMPATTYEDYMEQSMATQGCGCSYVNLLRVHHEEEPSQTHVDISGVGVIKNGKLVKEVYPLEEQRGLLWFNDEVQKGIISVHLDKENMVAVEIIETSTKIIPHLNNGKLSIDVKVKAEGNINEITSYKEIDQKEFAEIETDFARHIKSEMESILRVMRKEPVTEALGIGMAVYREYPEYWREIEEDWDEIFKDLEINIDVDTEIKNIGLIKNLNHPRKIKLESIIPWKE